MLFISRFHYRLFSLKFSRIFHVFLFILPRCVFLDGSDTFFIKVYFLFHVFMHFWYFIHIILYENWSTLQTLFRQVSSFFLYTFILCCVLNNYCFFRDNATLELAWKLANNIYHHVDVEFLFINRIRIIYCCFSYVAWFYIY